MQTCRIPAEAFWSCFSDRLYWRFGLSEMQAYRWYNEAELHTINIINDIYQLEHSQGCDYILFTVRSFDAEELWSVKVHERQAKFFRNSLPLRSESSSKHRGQGYGFLTGVFTNIPKKSDKKMIQVIIILFIGLQVNLLFCQPLAVVLTVMQKFANC